MTSRLPSLAPLRARGQLSMDFLVSIAFALILLLFLTQAFATRQAGLQAVQGRLDAEHLAARIAGAGNAAYLAGNQSAIALQLPDTLQSGEAYEASVVSNASGADVARVDITWSGGSASRPLLTTRASGTLTPGAAAQITNTNGTVTFA